MRGGDSLSAPIRAEKPNFRTNVVRKDGFFDPYWQKIINRQADLINQLLASNEILVQKVAALEQYNVDHP